MGFLILLAVVIGEEFPGVVRVVLVYGCPCVCTYREHHPAAETYEYEEYAQQECVELIVFLLFGEFDEVIEQCDEDQPRDYGAAVEGQSHRVYKENLCIAKKAQCIRQEQFKDEHQYGHHGNRGNDKVFDGNGLVILEKIKKTDGRNGQ